MGLIPTSLTSGQNIWVTPLDNQGNPIGASIGAMAHASITASHSINALSKAIDPKRGTGRTSKMLWSAACAKDDGEDVMIVIHDEDMIRYCLSDLMKGAWWGLERKDFVTIERAADQARGRDLQNCYVDHRVYELAMSSSLIRRCFNDLEDAIYARCKMYQHQPISAAQVKALMGNP